MPGKKAASLLNGMTLEQKVGQLLVLGFSGTYPHPDILRMIEEYHVAGFRVTPVGRKFHRYFGADHPATARVTRPPEPDERVYTTGDWSPPATAAEYARVLNVLRRRSLETGAGVPVYFALDFEGNLSADFLAPGMQGFPHPMGLTAAGDPTLCRRVARAVGTQLKAVGIDWIHSPVLDVNTNPANPEIGTRSYSALPEQVCRYARESLQGYTDANVVATGKHFPGRGHSAADVHFDSAVIDEPAGRMRDIHLAPYKALIGAGLPAIMLAHSVFPSLDPEKEIATLSRAVITDVLRGELGFTGVVMTDSFTMGGLVAKYEVAEAGVKCIQHGVDLILLKDENALRGQMYHGLLGAVKKGAVSEERLNEAAGRVLGVKERFGLLDEPYGMVTADAIDTVLNAPGQAAVAREAAERSIVILKNEGGLIPIDPAARVLVVEQVRGTARFQGLSTRYPGALYHALRERGVNAFYTDFENATFDRAWPVIRERARSAQLVVHTGFYNRGDDPHREHFEKFLTLGKPTVFVTNSPYAEVVSPQMPAVVVTFSGFVPSMQAAAEVITGKLKATARLGFDPGRVY